MTVGRVGSNSGVTKGVGSNSGVTKASGVAFFKEAFAMRRSSVGQKAAPIKDTDVVFRRGTTGAPPPPAFLGPGFMRRSCTFVTEGSWRKSSILPGSKDTKDRVNLALQVRRKAAQLGGEAIPEEPRGPGRVSRFVGNLKSWSSSEDVRQSVVGAINRTVNSIKQRPGSRKPKDVIEVKNEGRPRETTRKVVRNSAPPATNIKGARPMSSKTPVPTKKRVIVQAKAQNATSAPGHTAARASARAVGTVTNNDNQDKTWLRHLHEAQANYHAQGRNRRAAHGPPPPAINTDNAEDPQTQQELRDVDDSVDEPEGIETSVEGGSLPRAKSEVPPSVEGSPAPHAGSHSAPQTPAGPDSLARKTELLRRKDLEIRRALEEKQQLVADLVGIPAADLDAVAEVAAVVAAEPRDLALAALQQTSQLQMALNDAAVVTDADVIAANASGAGVSKASSVQTTSKLIAISATLTQLLNSLMVLISERDEERERMRKELVASRDRLHYLHMQQSSPPPTTDPTPPSAISAPSPPASRPSSFVSIASSGAEQSDVAEQEGNKSDSAISVGVCDNAPTPAAAQTDSEETEDKSQRAESPLCPPATSQEESSPPGGGAEGGST